MTVVGDARHYLAHASAASTPQAQLSAALIAAETLLRQGAPYDGRGLAALAASAPPGWLDRREVAQLTRLDSIAARVTAGSEVDPLDAEQATRLVSALIERVASGQTNQGRVLVAPPRGTEAGSPLTSSPARATAMPSPLPRAADRIGQHAPARRVSVVGRVARAALWLALAVLLVTAGLLIIPLVGPSWSRWLVWLVAAGALLLAIGDLLAVARVRPVAAALAALVLGVSCGVGWAVAADLGLAPPLGYVTGQPPAAAPAAPVDTPTNDSVQVGGRALVVKTLGNGLRVRTQPTVNAAEVTRLPDGTTVSVLEGPRLADDFVWWRVRGNGSVGWVADEWLQPVR